MKYMGKVKTDKLKRIACCCFGAPVCSLAYAHSGMYDRFLSRMVSVDAVVFTIFVMQVICFLLLRYCNITLIVILRRMLLYLTKMLSHNRWTSLLSGWILSSIVILPYWVVVSNWLFFLGLMLYVIFWLWYCFMVLSKEKREIWMTGYRALYYYVIAAISQLIGIVTYSVSYSTNWFRSIPYYYDEEYSMLGWVLYPNITGLKYLAEDAAILSLPLTLPISLLLILWLIKLLH